MTFADAIRRVRTDRKLTQAALAARAGITRTTLVRLEGGLKPGSLARQRLISALGFVILNELLAAAGDTDAARHLEGYAQSAGKAKRLAAAPGKGRATRSAMQQTTPVEPLRWRLLA